MTCYLSSGTLTSTHLLRLRLLLLIWGFEDDLCEVIVKWYDVTTVNYSNVLLLMFMQHLHVSPAEFHEWLCKDDEYSRLLIAANETDSELIVCATLSIVYSLPVTSFYQI